MIFRFFFPRKGECEGSPRVAWCEELPRPTLILIKTVVNDSCELYDKTVVNDSCELCDNVKKLFFTNQCNVTLTNHGLWLLSLTLWVAAGHCSYTKSPKKIYIYIKIWPEEPPGLWPHPTCNNYWIIQKKS